MKTYNVTVSDNGDTFWRVNGKLHRENGPAIEYASGSKEWWIEGKQLTESEFLAATDAKKPSAGCEGKIVTVDGKRYRLVRA